MKRALFIGIGFTFFYVACYLYLKTILKYEPYFHFIAGGLIILIILLIYLASRK